MRLLLVLLCGLFLRLLWLATLHDTSLWLDEPEYLSIAQALRAGGYLDDGLWVRVPLYPLLLALSLGPTESLLLARLVQSALGVLLIYQFYRVAWAAWHSERVALLCALLAAVYLPFIAYSFYLMAETLLLVLLCELLIAVLALARHPSWRRVALAGVLLGLAALVKPVALMCAPALLVALWLGQPRWRGRVGHALLAAACCLAVIAPWTLRNAVVHQRFILLDTTSGFNLWFGNRALDTTADEADHAEFMRMVYATRENLADRDRFFAQHGLELMGRDVPATVGLIFGEKLARFWRLDADLLARRQYGELALRCPVPRHIETHGILTPGSVAALEDSRFCERRVLNLLSDVVYMSALLGMLVVSLQLKHPRQLALAWAWIVPICLASIVTVVQPRLRLPLMPVLLPWGAAGLVVCWSLATTLVNRKHWVSGWQARLRRRWQTYVAPPLLIGGVLFLNIPALLGSQVFQTLGNASRAAGDLPAALQAYRQAACWYPERVGAHVAAGQVAEVLGRTTEALRSYRAATSHVSYEPRPRIGAARVLLAQGDEEAARAELGATLIGTARLEGWGYSADMVPSRHCIDLGGPVAATNYGYVIGFYPAYATWQHGPVPTFRASGAQAALRFGTQPTTAAMLSIRMSGGRPPGAPAPVVALAVNGRERIRTTVAAEWRVYQVFVPPSRQGVRLSLTSNTFTPAEIDPRDDDTRAYGLAIDWAALDVLPIDGSQPPTSARMACALSGTITRR
jgi:4-amino-4-deoxy-L-arabinose transferase-like glycosyltransferase